MQVAEIIANGEKLLNQSARVEGLLIAKILDAHTYIAPNEDAGHEEVILVDHLQPPEIAAHLFPPSGIAKFRMFPLFVYGHVSQTGVPHPYHFKDTVSIVGTLVKSPIPPFPFILTDATELVGKRETEHYLQYTYHVHQKEWEWSWDWDDLGFSSLETSSIPMVLSNMALYLNRMIRLKGIVTSPDMSDGQPDKRTWYMVDEQADEDNTEREEEKPKSILLEPREQFEYLVPDRVLLGETYDRLYWEPAQIIGMLVESDTEPFPAKLVDVTTFVKRTTHSAHIWKLRPKEG